MDAEKELLEITPSALGTKEHWDEIYDRENNVFDEIGDVGEVWFGESTLTTVVRWISEKLDLPLSSQILDVGTGNAVTLVRLLSAVC